MDIIKLGALRELARRKSIGAVAEALHRSQSAISQQIGNLQRELGVDLIERCGRGVRLTFAGRKLVARADRIFSELEAARMELVALKHSVVGHVRIGAFPSAVATLIPGTISTLLKAHSGIELNVNEMEAQEALSALSDFAIDVALIDNQVSVDKSLIETVALMDDFFYIGMPRHHPLASRGHLALADLDGLNVAIAAMPPAYFLMLANGFAGVDVSPCITARYASFAMMRVLIEAGDVAISLGQPMCIDQRGSIVRRLDFAPRREVSLAYRKYQRENPALRVFIEQFCADVAAFDTHRKGHDPLDERKPYLVANKVEAR
ncbi:LysR family transcriptional regulator [Pseudomonas sp. LRF_L74]|uniref:LysR family transcriptional regulator n=1 Tax=Pseudomonas sp. LRF_L74 TaxID=3369422 RepID=UPI003F60510C